MSYHGLTGEYYMFSNERGQVYGVHVSSCTNVGEAVEQAFQYFMGII
jgi:hypothetical protein